jgi:hypothetical protein
MDENRIPFLTIPGGKSDKIAREVIAQRVAAQKARIAYLTAKGPDILNLFGNERAIGALILKDGAPMPDGWRKANELHRKYSTEGVFIVPDKRRKDTYALLCNELKQIPSLPDAHKFSARLGFGMMIRGRYMLLCSYEKIGEQIVISVPRYAPPEGGLSDEEHTKQFVPPDCTQLKLSEYYAMKEASVPAVPQPINQ